MEPKAKHAVSTLATPIPKSLIADGVLAASSEEFSEERLCDLLMRERRHSAAELQSTIMDRVSGFCGDQLNDEAAMMIVIVN
jgi:hypothetical protein